MELTSEADEGEDAFGALVDDIEHERRKLAHHEGGHLAAAWAQNGRLCAADITPDFPYGGSARFRLGGDGYGASLARVIAILAGPMAERRFAPYEPDSGERDREMVDNQLEVLCRDPEAAALVLRHCRTEARRLVSLHWDLVEAFADALVTRETLTSMELHEIVADVEHRRARERWRAVEARNPAAGLITTEAACPGTK